MLAEQIQEGSRGQDRDPAKVFEGLQVAFVSRNQVVHTSRDGAFEDAMVGLVLHDAREVQRWRMRVLTRRSSRIASRTCGSVQPNLSWRMRRIALNSRRVEKVDEARTRHAQDRLAGSAKKHGRDVHVGIRNGGDHRRL